MAKTSLPASVWKELVEGLSAYQVAVNHGFVGTEEEWLASLEGADGEDGADGVIQSIVAGDGITVDNTDPANPVVNATGGGGGGGGGLTLMSQIIAASSYYTGAHALVANELWCLRDVDIFGLAIQLSNGAGSGRTYKGFIAKINDSNQVLEYYETDTYTLGGFDSFSTGMNITLMFPTPVSCVRDEGSLTNSYLIGVIRTDGVGSDIGNIGYSTSNPTQQWQFFRFRQTKAEAVTGLAVAGSVTAGATGPSGHFTQFIYAGIPSE